MYTTYKHMSKHKEKTHNSSSKSSGGAERDESGLFDPHKTTKIVGITGQNSTKSQFENLPKKKESEIVPITNTYSEGKVFKNLNVKYTNNTVTYTVNDANSHTYSLSAKKRQLRKRNVEQAAINATVPNDIMFIIDAEPSVREVC